MSYTRGQRAVLAAAGLVKEAGLAGVGLDAVDLVRDFGPPVAAQAAIGLGTALPMIGYTHSAYKDLQKEIPEAYRPAALTGGAVGSAGLAAGGGLAGHIALQLLAQKFPSLRRVAGHRAGQAAAATLGGLVAGIPGHAAGRRVGLELAKQISPDPVSELKFKLGI